MTVNKKRRGRKWRIKKRKGMGNKERAGECSYLREWRKKEERKQC